MERTHYSRKAAETKNMAEAVEILRAGADEIGKDLNALVNKYVDDLPLFMACLKGGMVQWERHLGEIGMAACNELMQLMMTVDVSEMK